MMISGFSPVWFEDIGGGVETFRFGTSRGYLFLQSRDAFPAGFDHDIDTRRGTGIFKGDEDDINV